MSQRRIMGGFVPLFSCLLLLNLETRCQTLSTIAFGNSFDHRRSAFVLSSLPAKLTLSKVPDSMSPEQGESIENRTSLSIGKGEKSSNVDLNITSLRDLPLPSADLAKMKMELSDSYIGLTLFDLAFNLVYSGKSIQKQGQKITIDKAANNSTHPSDSNGNREMTQQEVINFKNKMKQLTNGMSSFEFLSAATPLKSSKDKKAELLADEMEFEYYKQRNYMDFSQDSKFEQFESKLANKINDHLNNPL